MPAADPRPVLRPMTIDDYEAVFTLWSETAGVGLNESDQRPAIAAFLDRNPGLSTVAVEPPSDGAAGGGPIVGAMLAGHNGRRAEFVHLAVAESHRGRGVGTRIVEHCLRGLAEQGIDRCNVYVYATNEAALQFWRRLGFAEREDVVFMQGPTS